MASRASLILLLTATLTASSLAAAYEGPDQGQPWANHPAVVAEGGEFLPAGEFRRHHRHHPYYRRDRYPYSYYQPYPQPGYGAPTGDRYRGATTPTSRPMNPDPITVRPAIGELLGITAAR
ncbi:hypothetical protein [Pseudomonas oryzihabitans]|uniref:hypothetical protein n=1 Tax=Pseudomonas oryzihabitans TaxID=47885 RepID=UPI0020950399|nr:hypothetical protein [Pseudomonas psychrotolerans]